LSKIRLGQVEYINCLPLYYAIEQKLVPIDVKMIKGTPSKLNRMFLEGKIDITPISSIEFALNSESAVILPNMSISADGDVESILLFSKVPVTELDGLKISLSSSSATSVVLLKVLFEHYYHIQANFTVAKPDLQQMLEKADAALLIGDDALKAGVGNLKWGNGSLYVTDLGNAWKEFTGHKMVYALWVIRKSLVEEHPEVVETINKAFIEAKNYGFANVPALVEAAKERTGLSNTLLKKYFRTVSYDFGEEEKKALLAFYDYAYKSGLIKDRVKLNIWGEKIG
jgi:chorismate dehydratase